VTSTPPSLKILHLASSERWTGLAEPVTSLALVQQAAGHDVRLACVLGQSFDRRARKRGVDIAEGLHLDRRLHPLRLAGDLRAIPRYCRDNQIDVVHCHLLHDHWLAALSLGRLRREAGGRPWLVRTIHSSVAPRGDWFHRRFLFGRTDGIVCVFEDAARRTEKALRMSEGAVHHVGGAVDLDRFNPDLDANVLRSKWGLPPGTPIAGIVTRMRSGRGLRWLMRAIPKVLDQLPEAYFLVAGRGEMKHWFKRERLKPVFRDRLRYIGYRRQDLATVYATMDVSLFLGLGSEGTCRAILEAMACARPTIGTRLGAVSEMIDDGRTGMIVRDRDTDDLAEKLAAMLGDRERCAAMGREARGRAEAHFTEAQRAESVLAVYAQLARGRGISG